MDLVLNGWFLNRKVRELSTVTVSLFQKSSGGLGPSPPGCERFVSVGWLRRRLEQLVIALLMYSMVGTLTFRHFVWEACPSG